MLGSVAKAGRVLSLFDASSPERGVSEMAAALGIAKSSAHALLVPLGEVVLVRRLADGRYRLGRRILELSRTSSTALTCSGPSGRGCNSSRMVSRRRCTLVPSRSVRSSTWTGSPALAEFGIGMVMPAHCTALGKVLAAPRGQARPDEVLARHGGLSRPTDRTITTRPRCGTSSTEYTSRVTASTSGRPCPRCAASRHRSATGGETSRPRSARLCPQHAFTTNLEQVRTTVRSVADVISRIRRPNPRLATVG
jgi:hypothetical protein